MVVGGMLISVNLLAFTFLFFLPFLGLEKRERKDTKKERGRENVEVRGGHTGGPRQPAQALLHAAGRSHPHAQPSPYWGQSGGSGQFVTPTLWYPELVPLMGCYCHKLQIHVLFIYAELNVGFA